MALRLASSWLQGDREIVLTAVQQDGLALRWASQGMQGDPVIVLTAVQQAGAALEFATLALRGDATFTLNCVAADGWALEYVDDALRAQTQWALTAVRQNGLALSVCDPTTLEVEVALAAVSQNWLAFRWVPSDLQRDPRVLQAIGARWPFWDCSNVPWDVSDASRCLLECPSGEEFELPSSCSLGWSDIAAAARAKWPWLKPCRLALCLEGEPEPLGHWARIPQWELRRAVLASCLDQRRMPRITVVAVS